MRSVFMRYPEGRAKAVTFSYDDGVAQDRRLAALFDKYGMKATFNFNGERSRAYNYTKEEIQETFLSKGHEIAVHGLNHRANGYKIYNPTLLTVWLDIDGVVHSIKSSETIDISQH